MPVEAIFRDVELGPIEPAHTRLGKIPIEHAVPFFLPDEMFSDEGPESFRIVEAALVIGLILLDRADLIRMVHTMGFGRDV